MREDQIPRIKSRSTAIEKAFDDFLQFLGGLKDKDGRAFDLSRIIPTTDSSISDLRARAALIAGLIRKFDPKGGAALTPLSDFVALVNAGNAVTNALTQGTDTVNSHIQSSGGLQTIDYDNFHIVGANNSALNVQGLFKTIFDSMESYVQHFQVVFQATNPSRASFNFSSAADALSKIVGRSAKTLDGLQNALNAAAGQLEEVKAKQNAFAAVLDDVRAKQALLGEQAGQAAEALTNIAAKNDEAANLSATTAELRDRVSTYQAEFEGFQAQIEGMKASYAAGDEQLRKLIERFNAQAKSFDEMIEKSDLMLSGSTVAGLASEFGTIRNDLDTKLTAAHKSFNRAIIFLFVSALPLILFVFAPFLAAAFPDNTNLVTAIAGITANQSGWHYVGQVFARFIILLPAIWYVTFCTARYNSLFKLKEHYSYKYSMAVAVDGFKKQAPEYEGMIAALVFEQLAFNPADKLGKRHDSPESPPNPVAQLLIKVLRRDANEAEAG